MGICGSDSNNEENSVSDSFSDRDTTPGPTQKDGDAGDTTTKGGKKGNKGRFSFVPDDHVVRDVYQLMTIEKELGRGASCRVVKVNRKSDGKKLAMKEMRRDDKWNPMLFEQEVYILKKLSGHQNILQFRFILCEMRARCSGCVGC